MSDPTIPPRRSVDGAMSLPIRLAGALAACDRVHPLCNPYLRGPEDSKCEWLIGYSFAQKLSEPDRLRLHAALLETKWMSDAG